MAFTVLDRGEPIDVLFLAEGTYPYIRGGVSSWIHQLITGMPDIKFGVLFLGSREEDYGEIQYELPENLVFLKNFYMFSRREFPPPEEREGKEEVFLLKHFFFSKTLPDELSDYYFYTRSLSLPDFLYGKKTWYLFEEIYMERDIRVPFVDYFWTMRNILTPLWVVVKALEDLLDRDIKLAHSPSTGYAGFLGSMLKKTKGIPFVLTEHGIYTRERKIDILNARWIKSLPKILEKKYDIDDLKKLWISFFESIGRIAYLWADRVFSLYEDARKIQISLGCPPEKTQVIPNGIPVDRYKPLRRKKDEKIPPVVALIGRVTPIKDVKTFIKAVKVLLNKVPEAEGWVVGPEEEDPQYVQECKQLVRALKLEGKVKFLGFQKLTDIFPKIGLTTLTSISEGMPIVILESFAAGVPAVTTDVGSCRQLIYGGLNEEDKKIGKAGEVCRVADFRALAEAYARLLKNPKEWWSCSHAGIERVERFYTYERFIGSYRSVYESFMKVRHGGNIYRATETLREG